MSDGPLTVSGLCSLEVAAAPDAVVAAHSGDLEWSWGVLVGRDAQGRALVTLPLRPWGTRDLVAGTRGTAVDRGRVLAGRFADGLALPLASSSVTPQLTPADVAGAVRVRDRAWPTTGMMVSASLGVATLPLLGAAVALIGGDDVWLGRMVSTSAVAVGLLLLLLMVRRLVVVLRGRVDGEVILRPVAGARASRAFRRGASLRRAPDGLVATDGNNGVLHLPAPGAGGGVAGVRRGIGDRGPLLVELVDAAGRPLLALPWDVWFGPSTQSVRSLAEALCVPELPDVRLSLGSTDVATGMSTVAGGSETVYNDPTRLSGDLIRFALPLLAALLLQLPAQGHVPGVVAGFAAVVLVLLCGSLVVPAVLRRTPS